jgi:hypothetical protein
MTPAPGQPATDKIYEAFLRRQGEEGAELAAASDVLEIAPLAAPPADRFVARFHCATLVRDERGEVREADHFDVGIWFPSDYLRRVNPFQVVTWLAPADAFHPNIKPPFVCLGRLAPGMSLIDILYQAYEVGTGNKLTVSEDDALNWDACAWARRHMDRFPVDRRPLKRGAADFAIEEVR